MHYDNLFGGFKMDYDAYVLVKGKTFPEVPFVSDKDKEKRIINWVFLFEDALSHTFRRNSL